jgi:hypothetical protein
LTGNLPIEKLASTMAKTAARGAFNNDFYLAAVDLPLTTPKSW